MLILMAGIYSRQCSDPSPVMTGLDGGGQSEVKEGTGAQSQEMMRQKKRTSSVLSREGHSCQHWCQSYLDSPENTLAAEGWVVCCQG